MAEWVQYLPHNKIKKDLNKLTRVIITELGDVIDNFFSFQVAIRPQRTRFIKDRLALLGRNEFGYNVYANGLSPHLRQINGGDFRNSEWLFDLHWYVEGEGHYTTRRLPLIMECEWQQKRRGDKKVPFSGIKYDFQKLLVSNAEFRVMIFKAEKLSDFQNLGVYFEDTIKNYQQLEKGAIFLFIGFYDTQKTFYYAEISKR